MTHNQQIQVIKHLIIYIGVFILGAIAFSKCDGCHSVNPINHSEIANKIKLLNNKSVRLTYVNDSLQSIKQPLITRYKTIRKEVLVNIHDTVSVLKLVYKCDSVISLDSTIIVNCYDMVSNRDSVISMKDEVIKSVTDSISVLNKSLKSNKKYFKGLRHGIMAGVILTESASIGLKFIK